MFATIHCDARLQLSKPSGTFLRRRAPTCSNVALPQDHRCCSSRWMLSFSSRAAARMQDSRPPIAPRKGVLTEILICTTPAEQDGIIHGVKPMTSQNLLDAAARLVLHHRRLMYSLSISGISFSSSPPFRPGNSTIFEPCWSYHTAALPCATTLAHNGRTGPGNATSPVLS